MTKEYITKNRAKQFVCGHCNEVCSEEPCEPSDCDWMAFIDKEPAADVVEVLHERWERVIPTKSAAKWSTKVNCSNCHSVGYMRYNYCPNCGAKMDKEETNELD